MWWNVRCSSGSDQIRVKHGFGRSVQMTSIMLTTNSTTNTNAIKTGWEGAPVGTAEDPRPKLCHCVLTGARTQNSILLHTESLCQKMRPALLLTMEMWQIKSARASLNYECWHKNDKMLSAPAPAVTLPPCLHPASLSTDTGAEFSQPRTIQFYNINPWIKINKSMLKL